MELYQSSDAILLTGLSKSQLREWCGRRSIYRPSVCAKGTGKLSLYSWRDIIALRVLLELQSKFGVKASQWSAAIAQFQQCLVSKSFPALWNDHVVFPDTNSAIILSNDYGSSADSFLSIPLNPHLQALSEHVKTPHTQRNLPLISAIRKAR